ncbi:MAG: ABC transporter substrate-binding protein [Chloroflexota bacterium]|nr:ABC transporter substrate-binding protein [Rhodospirillales bacterium]MDE0380784.1 ABC transporter substrate-binding protein [Rhodospirillales bacterium]MDE2891353.1 ABC transporter substrate-binding protein [Chloroflexota bacterium]
MAVLGDKAKGTFAEREAAFRDVMARGFDVPLVARFVLGRHWKAATKEQRAAFTSILLDFLARIYTLRFDSYSYGGERFTVRSAIADESGGAVVRAQVIRSSGAEPVGLDFRVRWENGTPRVIDLHVEGISMLHTHRVEFGSVIDRKGIGGLLSDIRAPIETPIEDAAARRRSTRNVPRRRSADFATAAVRSGACS